MTTLHMRQDSRVSKAGRLIGSQVRSGSPVQRMVAGLAALLDAVDLLTNDASLDADDATVVECVCQLGARLISTAACAIYIKEPHQAGLRLAAVSPSTFPLASACPPEFLKVSGRRGASAVQIEATPDAARARMVLGFDDAAAILTVPVLSNAARCGLLVFVDHRGRRFVDEDLALAERLAQIAGLVLRNQRLHDLANGRVRPEALMWETLDPVGAADSARTLAQTRRLGHDLLTPHVVIVGKAVTDTAAERLHRSILRVVRNGLADLLGTTVIAIVPVDRLSGLVTEELSVGVSRPCLELGRYPAAYREAQEAVEIGTKLFGPGRITDNEDLDSYRFIPTFIKGGLTEHLEYQMMSRLPDDLLKTLEIYLDSGGNATRAAKQLFLHRNTLRQRLDRISALLNVDLTTSERWLSLQLAVKAARLARLAPSGDAGIRDGRSAASGAAPGTPTVEPAEVSSLAPLLL
jgi:hypothetical protein